MQRLKTRVQFQAVLAGTTVARSVHFALHRNVLGVIASKSSSGGPGGAGKSAGMVFAVPTAAPPRAEKPVFDPLTFAHGKSQGLFPVADLWLGAMVPKRWAKRAVTRNAIKRQIYNVCADFSPQQREAAFVVRLRRDFSRKEYLSATSEPLKQAVRAELQALFRDAARHA